MAAAMHPVTQLIFGARNCKDLILLVQKHVSAASNPPYAYEMLLPLSSVCFHESNLSQPIDVPDNTLELEGKLLLACLHNEDIGFYIEIRRLCPAFHWVAPALPSLLASLVAQDRLLSLQYIAQHEFNLTDETTASLFISACLANFQLARQSKTALSEFGPKPLTRSEGWLISIIRQVCLREPPSPAVHYLLVSPNCNMLAIAFAERGDLTLLTFYFDMCDELFKAHAGKDIMRICPGMTYFVVSGLRRIFLYLQFKYVYTAIPHGRLRASLGGLICDSVLLALDAEFRQWCQPTPFDQPLIG